MKLHGINSLPCGYTVKRLILQGKTSSLDISDVYTRISITESMTSPVMMGELELIDTNNIVTNMPLKEGDTVKGTLTVLDDDVLVYEVDPIGGYAFTFEIVKISQFRVRMDAQTLLISFVSPIWTNNMKGRVSKAYEQRSYSDVVNEIFQEHLAGGGMNQIFGSVGKLLKKASGGLGSLGGALGGIGSSIKSVSSSISNITGKVSQVVNQANAVASTVGRLTGNNKLNQKINNVNCKVCQAIGAVNKVNSNISSVSNQLTNLTGNISGVTSLINCGFNGGLLSNLNDGPKPLEGEQSDGLYSFVIPNWKPLQAIAWLTKRSSLNKSNNFRFFETKDCFRYVTDTTLINQTPVMTLYQHDPNMQLINTRVGNMVQSSWDTSVTAKRYGNILSYRILDSFDINKASNESVMGKHLVTQDSTTKQITDGKQSVQSGGTVKTEKSIIDSLLSGFKSMGGMNGGEPLISESIANWLAGDEGEDKLAVYPTQAHQYNNGEQNDRPSEWLRQHDSTKNQMNIFNVEVTIPGNFTIKAGDLVNVEWRSPQEQPMDGILSLLYDSRSSGNWIIKTLTRNFNTGESGFTTILTLARNDRKFSDNFKLMF